MNERLSRMERYSRKQHERRAVREQGSHVSKEKREAKTRLRRSEIHQDSAGTGALTAPTEPDSGLALTSEDQMLEDGVSAVDMPSRRELYPSHRIKWTKWFYNSLVFIFIALMILLFFWGMQQSTWGKHQ